MCVQAHLPKRKNIEGSERFLAVALSIAGAGCVGARTGEVATSTAAQITPAIEETATATLVLRPPVRNVWRWESAGSLVPVTTAGRIWLGDWSPDGRFLAYWSWRPEDLRSEDPYPEGDLHFLAVETGRTCESMVDVGYPYFATTLMGTVAGDMWAATLDGHVTRTVPCDQARPPIYLDLPGPIHSVDLPPAGPLILRGETGALTLFRVESADWLLLGGEAGLYAYDLEQGAATKLSEVPLSAEYSPDGRYAAPTESVDRGSNYLRTTIVGLDDTEELASVVWQSQPAMAWARLQLGWTTRLS